MSEKITELLHVAGKLEKRPWWHFLPFAAEPDYRGAAECYEKVANLHKVNANWLEAIRYLKRAIALNAKSDHEYHDITLYVSMYDCYIRLNDLVNAEACNNLVCEYYEEKGDVLRAAERMHKYGSCLKEAGDEFRGAAINAFTKVVRYPIRNGTVERSLNELAELALSVNDFETALNHYLTLTKFVADGTTKNYYQPKYHLLGVLTSLVIGDVVQAQRLLAGFEQITTCCDLERELCAGIIDAVSNMDLELFTNSVVEYDRIRRLDPHQTAMLLRLKTNISFDLEQHEYL